MCVCVRALRWKSKKQWKGGVVVVVDFNLNNLRVSSHTHISDDDGLAFKPSVEQTLTF